MRTRPKPPQLTVNLKLDHPYLFFYKGIPERIWASKSNSQFVFKQRKLAKEASP